MSAVRFSDVKAAVNITGTSHDNELQAMLDRAEATLARRVGPLTSVTVPNEVHTGPGPIRLRKLPAIAVVSATSGGAAVNDLDLDTDSGVLYGTFGTARRGVRVTYTAGRTAPLDADLEEAVLELVKHLWETQRPAGSQPPGSLDRGDAPSGGSYLLPYRVQSLIEPYMQYGMA